MAKNPQIFVEYIAQTAQLSKATSDIEKSGGRVKTAMGGVAKAVGTGLAVGAVVNFGKSCIDAAQESEVATKRLENVFRSMGDTTGQAAKQAEKYAGALMKKTGIDDEAIMSAQALLATFKNVSDETGRQAGIFDRATSAAADLAAAGFGTLDTNAKQLGKALQDPVKGLTALGRAGVTFTASEKERIKTLVESNRITEAQKVILAAVETQVKGTAEATATGSQKAKVAFGEMQESLGKALLPAIQAITPVLTDMFNAVAPLVPVLAPLALAIGAIVVATKAWTAAQVALDVVMDMNPWILAIIAVTVAIVLLIKKWDTVKAVVVAALGTIKNVFASVFGWISDHWTTLLALLGGPLGLVVAGIIKHWDRIKDAVGTVIGTIKGLWNGLLGFLASVGNRIGGLVDAMVRLIKAPINMLIKAWNRLGFKIPEFTIHLKLLPDIHFPGFAVKVPQIPELAAGGVVSRPTLAMVGEGTGREIVTPESLLRQIVSEQAVHVRVFIGDQELRGLVRTEVDDANTGLARTLLSGARG